MKIYVVTKEVLRFNGEDNSTDVICAYTAYAEVVKRAQEENTKVFASASVYDKEHIHWDYFKVELIE